MSAVTCIIEKRVSQLFHVHTDLMCSSCLQAALHQGDITEPFQHGVVRDGCFTIVTVREYTHHQPVFGITADIALYGPALFCHVSPDEGHVESFRLFPVELC